MNKFCPSILKISVFTDDKRPAFRRSNTRAEISDELAKTIRDDQQKAIFVKRNEYHWDQTLNDQEGTHGRRHDEDKRPFRHYFYRRVRDDFV